MGLGSDVDALGGALGAVRTFSLCAVDVFY